MSSCNLLCVGDKAPTKMEYAPLFFGDTGNISRIDKIVYPRLEDLFKYGFSKVWTWTAINFKEDIIGFKKFDKIGERIFLLNNGFQFLMDNGVSNIYFYLTLISTNTELGLNYGYIAQNEQIHNNSYSFGLMQLFGSQANDKINVVHKDSFVKSRMDKEIGDAEEFIEYVIKQGNRDRKAFELIFKVLLDTILIENVKFPFSFFTTYSLNKAYDNAIQGFTLLIKMINRDEQDYHVPVNKEVLKILRKQYPEVWDSLKEYTLSLIDKVEQQEKEWVDYLLKDGSFNGFNKEICYYFIEHRIDDTLKKLGFSKKYNHPVTDFISWYNDYRKIENQNASLQEVSNNNYEKGTIKNDLKENLAELREVYG